MSQEEKDRLASRICEALAVLLSTETEKVTVRYQKEPIR